MSNNDLRPRSREFAALNPAAPKPVDVPAAPELDPELEALAAELEALDAPVELVAEPAPVVVEEAPVMVAPVMPEAIVEAPPIVEVSAPVEQPVIVAVTTEETPLYLAFIQQHYGYTGSVSNSEAWGTFCMRFPGMRAHASKHPDMRLLNSEQMAILASNVA